MPRGAIHEGCAGASVVARWTRPCSALSESFARARHVGRDAAEERACERVADSPPELRCGLSGAGRAAGEQPEAIGGDPRLGGDVVGVGEGAQREGAEAGVVLGLAACPTRGREENDDLALPGLESGARVDDGSAEGRFGGRHVAIEGRERCERHLGLGSGIAPELDARADRRGGRRGDGERRRRAELGGIQRIGRGREGRVRFAFGERELAAGQCHRTKKGRRRAAEGE